jgi:predicted SnoaL-like aldol condensation-catalyzing enzyme
MRGNPILRLIHFLLASLFSALLLISSAQAAKLYKWVDEEGNIRYSDRLTVEQARQRHQTLTPDGRVIETKERSLSDKERAEIARQKEQERIEAEKQARIQAEKDHHDRVLMMTFTNEDEILEAQQERIDVIDSVIQLLRKNIESEQEKLKNLKQRADTQYINKNKAVPGGLAQNIEYFSEKILNKQKQLELKIEEKSRIKQQYANDLIRYRELSGKNSAAPE